MGSRTTLTLDEDVLTLARAIADQDGRTMGEIVSDLARRGAGRAPISEMRNGIPLLPTRKSGVIVTLDLVNALRDAEP